MNYSSLTRRYFDAAPHAGVIAGASAAAPTGAGEAAVRGIGRGTAGSRAQGTWVQFDIQVAGGGALPGPARIQAARFLAYACPHTIAVAAWLAEHAAGLEVRPVLPENVQSLRERFGVPVEKLGKLLIVEDAWVAAVSAALEHRA
jgi:hypothetical protein